jgi:hypothetical protein
MTNIPNKTNTTSFVRGCTIRTNYLVVGGLTLGQPFAIIFFRDLIYDNEAHTLVAEIPWLHDDNTNRSKHYLIQPLDRQPQRSLVFSTEVLGYYQSSRFAGLHSLDD